MNSLIETLNHWGGNFGRNAWSMLWQSSLLIVAVLAFDFLLRRQLRASIRYALWLVVLVKLILPPTLALPTNPAWWIHKTPPPATVKTTMPKFTVTYDQSLLPEIAPASLPVFVPVKPVLTLAAWLLIVSISASVLLFVWLLARWWQITRQVRRAMISPHLTGLADDVKRHAAMKFKSSLVKLTANTMSPAVCGLFHPVILIPQSLATEFSDDQMRAVLLHELIHLQRRDVWVNFLQSLLQMVYWWHPLVWVANARIRRVREEAVDDAVMLTPGGTAEIYAPTLLEVAKLALNRPLASLGLVGILESRSALRQRIERLINFNAPRKAGLTLVSFFGILVFSAVAVPMGEGPDSASMPLAVAANSAAEIQSVTLQVNPQIFKQNVQAQAARTMHATTDEVADVLIDLLRGEGVDCNPPHVFIFDMETGKLTAKNSPDALEIFRQVIEQLNRPDGKCQLPLQKTSFRRKQVLITGQIYALSTAEIKQALQGLDLEKDKSGNSLIGPIAADHFAAFNHKLESLGLNAISRPRILTSHGQPAQFFVGRGKPVKSAGFDTYTNGIELDCYPYVDGRQVELAFSASAAGELFGDDPAHAAVLRYVNGRVAAEDHGGVVICANDPNGSSQTNLVLVIGVQIYTNASSANLGQRLEAIVDKKDGSTVSGIVNATLDKKVAAAGLVQDGKLYYEIGRWDEAEKSLKSALAIDPENPAAKYYLDLVQAAQLDTKAPAFSQAARQIIVEKLYHLKIKQIDFDHANLEAITRQLNVAAKENDPEKKGVHFSLGIDPVSGQFSNTNITVIGLHLTNVWLADVLDVVAMTAVQPVKYSVLDDGVVFSVKESDNQKLFMRAFKLDRRMMVSALQERTGMPMDDTATNISAAARSYFTTIGVDLEFPKGKAVFYNDRLGLLFVKATEADLDIIEHALQLMGQVTPQVHIKTRFIEAPKGSLDAFWFANGATNQPVYGNQGAGVISILSAENFKVTLHALQGISGIETLAEPEVVATSGRQTQMRATESIVIMTNITFQEVGGVASMVTQTNSIETGPIFDVVPYVLADGHTIDLESIASMTSFLGYDQSTNTAIAYNSKGERVDVPIILPTLRIQQAVAHVNLQDNQTVLLGKIGGHYLVGNREASLFPDFFARAAKDPRYQEKELLVFVTATIVDPAGNHVHKDDAMTYADFYDDVTLHQTF